MVPVATLPAAAILMGVGYWIDPVGWGKRALAAFFIKSVPPLSTTCPCCSRLVWLMVCPKIKTVLRR
jgi:phosphotransferase system  glucose/maltose/N-acetylglucosamine-specific IIC component